MSTAHLNEPDMAGQGEGEPKVNKKDWRKFRAPFVVAGLLLAVALAWWLWPASEETPTPTPAPIVTKTPVPAPTTPKVVTPAPVSAPTVVAVPTPAPVPLPSAATPVEAKISDVEKIIGGKRNNCSVLEIGGKVIRETCFPTE